MIVIDKEGNIIIAYKASQIFFNITIAMNKRNS